MGLAELIIEYFEDPDVFMLSKVDVEGDVPSSGPDPENPSDKAMKNMVD